MSIFKNKIILITGGTGSFGSNFVKHILDKYKDFGKIVIFSRDELKQFHLSKELEKNVNFKKIRFLIGDIRDLPRVQRAIKDVDFVIHAAALKQVPSSEYNPFEAIKTNVLGTQNLIEASLDAKVSKFIALSTDKAAAPINLYGATKLCSDKIVISSNNMKGKRNIIFSLVRYGNVMFSRGSVVPEFIKQQKDGLFKITHKEMTRFNITMQDAIEKVIWLIKNGIGGEILVPKLKSIRIIDLARAINKKCKIKFTGIRPGEKIHEELITNGDSFNTFEGKSHYVILNFNEKLKKVYKNNKNYKKVKNDFCYNSKNNVDFMNINEIKKILIKSNFI